VELIRSEGDNAIQDKNGDEVYGFFQNILDFYFQSLKRDSIDDQGFNLIGSIHYDDDQNPSGYGNAFWNGQQMVFGERRWHHVWQFHQVSGCHWAWTHAWGVAIHGLSTISLAKWALNESISDVFGSMVKQYTLKQTADEADWLIGKELLMPDILAQGNLALRSMHEPGKAFKIPPWR